MVKMSSVECALCTRRELKIRHQRLASQAIKAPANESSLLLTQLHTDTLCKPLMFRPSTRIFDPPSEILRNILHNSQWAIGNARRVQSLLHITTPRCCFSVFLSSQVITSIQAAYLNSNHDLARIQYISPLFTSSWHLHPPHLIYYIVLLISSIPRHVKRLFAAPISTMYVIYICA
jgi:hypothetical protein